MEVSVRELKNHLSEYLRRVQAGERVVVTSRGKPIATLAAPERMDRSESADAIVSRLEAMSWIIPARKRGKPAGATCPIPVPEGTVDEIIDWARSR